MVSLQQYVEKEKRKFQISSAGQEWNRTQANTKHWFERQKQDIDSKLEKVTKGGIGSPTNSSNDTKEVRVGDGEVKGCDAMADFDCNNCGLFSA